MLREEWSSRSRFLRGATRGSHRVSNHFNTRGRSDESSHSGYNMCDISVRGSSRSADEDLRHGAVRQAGNCRKGRRGRPGRAHHGARKGVLHVDYAAGDGWTQIQGRKQRQLRGGDLHALIRHRNVRGKHGQWRQVLCQLPRFDDHQKRPTGGALQRHAVLYGRDRRAKGLAGQGNIYTVTVNADRTSTVAVEGDYTIAEPTPKEAKQKPPSQ